MDDPRFADARSRGAHSRDLKSELARRIAPLSAPELERELMEAGCPASVVRTTREVLRMPVLHERGMLQPTQVAGRNELVTLLNAGVVTDADGPSVQGPVPALGASTDAVLSELGYAPAGITRLHANGTI